MAQQIINVGAAPNDGDGDPIRTAFQKTNSNFTELYDRVQDTVPTSRLGTVGDAAGMIAFNNTYLYVCVANYNGISNIWQRIAFDTTPW